MKHRVKIPGEFAAREDGRAWALLLGNLVVVLTAGMIAWHIGTFWAYALAFILVGARGQACYILQHEAMHNLLFTAPRTNERMGAVLSAILDTRFYMGRKIHWDHHRFVGNTEDPNESFHNVENRPPGLAVVRFFLFHLLGGRLLMMVSNLGQTALQVISPKQPGGGGDAQNRPFPSPSPGSI